MEGTALGLIHFVWADGRVWVGEHWNPQYMTRSMRSKAVDSLREIADRLAEDKFADGSGEYVFQKAPYKEPK